jgi:hypothetical protein
MTSIKQLAYEWLERPPVLDEIYYFTFISPEYCFEFSGKILKKNYRVIRPILEDETDTNEYILVEITVVDPDENNVYVAEMTLIICDGEFVKKLCCSNNEYIPPYPIMSMISLLRRSLQTIDVPEIIKKLTEFVIYSKRITSEIDIFVETNTGRNMAADTLSAMKNAAAAADDEYL